MFRQSYEISLMHPKRGVNVDLHRAFLPACYPFKLDIPSLSPYSLSLLGREVPTLEPTEHLLVLCVHGSKHGWRELRWIYDLHQLCRRQKIDWERLESLAREHRAYRTVAVGLELSRRLFGTNIPSFTPAEHLIERTLEHLEEKQHSGWRRHRYQWEVADHWSSRYRYLFWTLFYPHQRDLDFISGSSERGPNSSHGVGGGAPAGGVFFESSVPCLETKNSLLRRTINGYLPERATGPATNKSRAASKRPAGTGSSRPRKGSGCSLTWVGKEIGRSPGQLSEPPRWR